jgi:His-Xaa-Ser system radical SAM maturase HxsB
MAKFQPITFYANRKEKYQLLPFKYSELDANKYLLTNIAGEYLVVEKPILKTLVEHKLDTKSLEYINLRARHFILDEYNEVALDLLALKVRTRYQSLSNFTSLHIFVVSLRCEHSCPYCQVSRQSEDKKKYDMTQEIAEKALELVFLSPSPTIKIEFQGGEPLLNFDLIKFIVQEANKLNLSHNKFLDFVIATNLALIDREILHFCKENKVHISTSLDGPEDLHNKNRPRPGKNSYEKVIDGIALSRDILGRDQVSALMTTTELSLERVEQIIDEYLQQKFDGIFLRHLSPYGFALKTKTYMAYSTDRWLNFYKKGIEYIIELNRKGIDFREYYACTVLKKMCSFLIVYF